MKLLKNEDQAPQFCKNLYLKKETWDELKG